ncbi:MAG TPA: D-2-hydroxyacid dehydrogenase family protein [Geminicoccaceae bacterium]|nr:D-2-hydroxyacid dehydrogenase family protein [Geminicoccaceae bacterium]
MKLAILDDYQRVALDMADWSPLAGAVEITAFDRHLGGPDAVAEALRDFEIVGIMRERTPFPAALLERLPKLRLLVTTGRRNDAVDVEAAGRLGITVCGTASPGHATAELAMGLVLALARGLVVEAGSMWAGGWQVGLGRDLGGATLGVLGLGRLGSHVAGLGRAFGMDVIAWSQNLSGERAAEVGVRRVAKDELFAGADFVTIHLRLSPRTRGLVGARELALMRPDAYLVNTSRGPVVDEAALIDALGRRVIAGAALDVYDAEPLPAGHPLRRVPNLLLTPHIGYVTRETYRVFYGEMAEVIQAFLAGQPYNLLTNGGP